MLHQVDGIFAPGAQFPPASEKKHLDAVHDFGMMYEGEYGDVDDFKGHEASHLFRSAFERIRRDDGSEHVVGVNLFRVAVDTHCDLLFGEESELKGVSEGDNDPLHEWSEREQLWPQLAESVADARSCGDGYLRVVPDAGQARLSVVSPDICFPIVAADDCRKELAFVVTWKWCETSRGLLGGEKKAWKGIAEIHEPGQYRRAELTFGNDGQRITSYAEGPTVKTGYPGLAIVHVCGPRRKTKKYHGTSVLADIDGIVAEIEVCLAQEGRILDKNADPSINAPESAFNVNPITKEWELKAGGAFLMDPETKVAASYMEMGGQSLTHLRARHDSLIAHFCRQTNIARVLFDSEAAGAVTSGAALKRQMIPTLSDVARWRQSIDPAVKRVAEIAAAIEPGVKYQKIEIEWADGLPDDPLETAQTVALKRAAKVQSQESGVTEVSGKSGESVTAEVTAINSEGIGPAAQQAPQIQLQSFNNGA